jgi:2-C-methyl-D-erythritol 4-phosphate cytidylyltransferase / 2-C-methyl-D-erythritol 2,4-cyclodiphosphate synthase
MAASRTVALLMAAGRGERSGGGVPKQFRRLAGRPLIGWSHAALAAHPAIDAVVVVGDPGPVADALGPVRVVPGGAERRDSVRAGLEALADDSVARVLVHDAARPIVPAGVIDRLVAALDTHVGAIPVLPVADTLVRGDGATVPRAGLSRVQTPQAFAFDALLGAHRAWPEGREATDDAQMVREAGHAVALVLGDAMLEKVTHAADFAAAEARLGAEYRSAGGFDVHRLEAGEELWLGGVRIPHDKGLSGHSDSDVALHALTDALLGTVGAGDIGTHFPPSDPQWKGARSGIFLQHAAQLVAAAGGTITFVDLTLICEAPKIGPHRAAIRAEVARLLRIAETRVSIKATTTEGLGFTGRGEGIAAQAVATVRLPITE